jgi:lysophospholipase L1-like esterase
MELGSLRLPGIARNAVEDYVDSLLDSVEDLNTMLADAEVDVQSITIGDDRIVVTGVQEAGPGPTSAAVLAGLANQAASLGGPEVPPEEVLGPGVVDGTFAEGRTYVVALGNSLAANVGVDRPAEGYVSRVHNQLQIRDGRDYGLFNFGVSGETSGTMVRDGQLDEAVAFLRANRVAYVIVDIGANDLLGHLTSPDCGEGLEDPACRQRIESSLSAFEANIERVFDALRSAAPEATLVYVRAYNPFSLGTGIQFERDSSRSLDDLNDLAAAAAMSREILVADAFTPMEGTAAVTTHMLDDPADIHPNGLGYDVLAQAVLAALSAESGG